MRRSARGRAWPLLLGVAVALSPGFGCAGSKKEPTTPVASTLTAGDATSACDASVPGREVSEYDTSGDNRPDVRKVFMAYGTGVESRLVMICRETDVNADGRKDVVRYYDDMGRSLREESDRDFDGKMDLALVFQDGQVVLKESDENRDGRIDTKIFYEDGKPLRAERDLTGRSTSELWRPNRWEYYEDGRLVRMGTDLDGDTRVDRWDRDATLEEAGQAELPTDGSGDENAAPYEAGEQDGDQNGEQDGEQG